MGKSIADRASLPHARRSEPDTCRLLRYDAVFTAEGIPCAMIFVCNDHGSHNPHEAMALEDFGEACRLLFGLLDQLA